jgi:hypothetical protein
MCVAGVCTLGGGGDPDAGTDGTVEPAADFDKDTIPDDKDNCRDKANTDQADEDKDGRGDVCDLCPQIAGEPATDTDGDGIGDACDPHPTVKDLVWRFETFRGGLPAVGARTGHWTFVQERGSVQTSSPGTMGTDGEWLDTPFMSRIVPPDNFSVTATITIQQLVTNNSGDHSAGVEVFDANALNMNGAGVRCGLEHFDGSGLTLFVVDDINPNGDMDTSYSWAVNTQYRITLTRQGSLYTCKVFGPNGPTDTATVSRNSQVLPRNTDDSVDIWAFGSSAEFGSVQIVGPP